MNKTGDEKALWDVLNALRSGPLGRLNHAELEAVFADLDAQGWQIAKKPDAS
jgi:hypothetical protein